MVAVGLLAVSMPALGQSRLGATDGRGPLPPPPLPITQGTSPAAESADTEHRQRADLTAARLLAVARKDIAEGKPEIAQRVLEQLIARFPDSTVAGEARRDLFTLYAGDRRIAAARPAPASPPPPTQAARPISPAQPAPPLAAAPAKAPPGPERPAADGGWRTNIIGFRRLQDDLRNGVGDRIFFSAGSADLGSRARAVITAQADWLAQRPDIDIVIEGHADDAMVGADNDRLAETRAAALRDRLVAEGVEAHRIRIMPLGARDPVAVCSDSDCAVQNRRAVVQVAVRRSQGTGN